ncbi:MAG: nitronate monooxygenase [Sphingobacterium sp.]|uniref:NAD(P)H-dependent flavin oxidoreductase n=1 Tax=unclassified Sphingobacterium TaxID=2609468 RepID=UPI000985612E|nr:nitronate monooxygenase [Sphingobacterium sp. CZ-UAM]MDF2515149.1 nitronate monooxygenase [Sphingobacterium sp.]OOG19414.1 2-nitropropane dioxygenase [Sphingobacterium sp. CZ-UAM]
MWNDTKFTRLLGIDLPIVQGPFGGKVSSIDLTAIVSNSGGLGSYGCQPFDANEIVKISEGIKKKTDKPFNLNLWVKDRDDKIRDFDDLALREVNQLFKPYFNEAGIELPRFPFADSPSFENQIEAIFTIKPAVFSFVYGIPSADILEKCRQLNIKTVGAATTLDEAIAIENAGVDALVATGFDAGGHRVSFLDKPEESLIGTFSLIPQIADHVNIPVIAAGGIVDSRGLKAAFSLGADAVQMGTAFLATEESGASQAHRKKLFSKEARYTTLTKVFTGRLSRAIKNRLTEELKAYQEQLAPYPLQGKIVGKLGAYPANSESDPELKSFWSGQAASILKFHHAKDLIDHIIADMGTS